MQEIVNELEEIGANARITFGELSPTQINWKQSAECWSVGQCFEHLIKINAAFFPQIESIIKGEKKLKVWEKYSPFSEFFGNLLFKSVSPEARRKLKAPKTATPTASIVSSAIIVDFVNHQAELIDKVRQTDSLNPKSIIITSPFIKAITYSLFDAYRIIVTHEKRHFEQAERVAHEAGFPPSE